MENYADAAARHFVDAQLLEKEKCVENADHHYGFAAECAIKKVLGMHPGFAPLGILDAAYRKHIDVLWGKVHLQSIQKISPTLSAVLRMPNQFQDWSVDQRYAANGFVSLEAVQKHGQAAIRLLGATGINGVRRR